MDSQYFAERECLKDRSYTYCGGGDVLELGCGVGEWTQFIAARARSVTCVDSSSAMLARAAERTREAHCQPIFMQADILGDCPLVVSYNYDVIVCYFLLSILPPPAQAELISRIKRWLRPGGTLIIAESLHMARLPCLGLGRKRFQRRSGGSREYLIYKERLSAKQIDGLLGRHGFRTCELSEQHRWFLFVAARQEEPPEA